MKKLLAAFIVAGTSLVSAQTSSTSEPTALPVLQINTGKVTGNVSPTLYGLMTEEINFSYEGGLYAELFKSPAPTIQPGVALAQTINYPNFR